MPRIKKTSYNLNPWKQFPPREYPLIRSARFPPPMRFFRRKGAISSIRTVPRCGSYIFFVSGGAGGKIVHVKKTSTWKFTNSSALHRTWFAPHPKLQRQIRPAAWQWILIIVERKCILIIWNGQNGYFNCEHPVL